ncbi:DNA-processing protein DprA, partial [Vibrio parahaemolyticus]|uniref:DNA-processing protein DprA n=1 Tax=Vibrio parahaemolyticus TaxID=670 RepID=UPI0020123B27
MNAGYQAIVSGLAAGSDTLGHQAALKYSGRTIAVIGTPLDQYFPKENRELQDEIAKNHLLVSEYPIGIRSFGSFFANRNRTTVGLSSEGVVVARAGDRSGTQYAIRHCVEQGKQLYALENNIYEP